MWNFEVDEVRRYLGVFYYLENKVVKELMSFNIKNVLDIVDNYKKLKF